MLSTTQFRLNFVFAAVVAAMLMLRTTSSLAHENTKHKGNHDVPSSELSQTGTHDDTKTREPSHACSGHSCGHHHSQSDTLLRIASEWQDTFKRGKIAIPKDGSKTLLEELGQAMILELAHQESNEKQEHSHKHGDADRPKRFSKTWMKEKLARLKEAAMHVTGDVVEGFPEYGIVFAAITLSAEAVDHMVFDEFIPVIGMIPMCVLIAEFARRASSFVSEGYGLMSKQVGNGRLLPHQELKDWSKSRQVWRKRTKRLEFSAKTENGKNVSHVVNKPGLWSKFRKKQTSYTDIEKELTPELKWVFSMSSLWQDVAKTWVQNDDRVDGGQTRDLSEALEAYALRMNQHDTLGALTAYEIADVARFSKALASAFILSFYAEKKMSRKEMFGLRYAVGKLGKSIRRFETELIRELTDTKNRPVKTGELVMASRAALEASQESLVDFAKHLETGDVDQAKRLLGRSSEQIGKVSSFGRKKTNSSKHKRMR